MIYSNFLMNKQKLRGPLLKNKDRVVLRPEFSGVPMIVAGTVLNCEDAGLFLNIKWDLEYYLTLADEPLVISSYQRVDRLKFEKEA